GLKLIHCGARVLATIVDAVVSKWMVPLVDRVTLPPPPVPPAAISTIPPALGDMLIVLAGPGKSDTESVPPLPEPVPAAFSTKLNDPMLSQLRLAHVKEIVPPLPLKISCEAMKDLPAKSILPAVLNVRDWKPEATPPTSTGVESKLRFPVLVVAE